MPITLVRRVRPSLPPLRRTRLTTWESEARWLKERLRIAWACALLVGLLSFGIGMLVGNSLVVLGP